jgi:hypothetical protein
MVILLHDCYLQATPHSVSLSGQKKHVELALQLKPDFTMRQFKTIFPNRDSKVRKEFLLGLQKAGIPE